jgi:hypothetical protein
MVDHPDSVRTGVNRSNLVVTGEVVDGTFTTDQAIGTTPTLTITLSTSTGEPVKKFLLEDVQFALNCTNAVTYQLYLLEAATADDVLQTTDLAFFSPAAQADAVNYRYTNAGYSAALGTAEAAQYKLPRIVELETPNTLYFMLDWSAAPGATTGIIKIRGRLLK